MSSSISTERVIIAVLGTLGDISIQELRAIERIFPNGHFDLQWLTPLNARHYLELCTARKPRFILVIKDEVRGMCELAINAGFKHLYLSSDGVLKEVSLSA